jgi:hypothetical protein
MRQRVTWQIDFSCESRYYLASFPGDRPSLIHFFPIQPFWLPPEVLINDVNGGVWQHCTAGNR